LTNVASLVRAIRRPYQSFILDNNAMTSPDENITPLDPEAFWDAILSRDPQQIRTAFAPLGRAEKQAVLQHLYRMATEPGWHPEQRLSARTALKALGFVSDPLNEEGLR